MTYEYKWPRPMVTVDIVLFTKTDNAYRVLLIKRGNDPFKGHWALPGGFLDKDEDLEDAAWRELREETGLKGDGHLKQIGAYGKPGRDPRGHSVSVAFMAFVKPKNIKPKAGDDASEAKWFRLKRLPGKLAFDHWKMILAAAQKLEKKLGCEMDTLLCSKTLILKQSGKEKK